jgi:predicted nuclease of predicted toxin-antitoxin system
MVIETKIRYLADMNISPSTVASLSHMGWEIIRVSDVLPFNAADREILELARQRNMVVITQDLDFSMLLALGGFNRPNLITLRLSVSDPNTITNRLLDTVSQWEDSLRNGCAITIEDKSVRIRRLPIV